MNKHSYITKIWIYTALTGLSACAAQPDQSQLGSCKISSCSNARVAGSNMKVVPTVASSDISLACTVASGATAPLNRPVTVRFQIYEDLGDGKPDGAGATVDYGTQKVQIGGIGFAPYTVGQLSEENTNDEFIDPDTGKPDAQFLGVATPSSEWCSDSCGGMKFDVWPECIAGKTNPITVGIEVQGIITEKEYHISVDNSKDE